MKKKIIILSLLSVLCIIGAFIYDSVYKEPVVNKFDPNVSIGHRKDKPKEEIEEEKNIVTDGYAFDVYINPEIELEYGDSLGLFNIENIKQNNYFMQVDINLMDKGETLYRSGIIKPNRYIGKARLSRFLQKGKYPSLVTFTAIDRETNKEVGTVVREINIYVDKNPQ